LEVLVPVVVAFLLLDNVVHPSPRFGGHDHYQLSQLCFLNTKKSKDADFVCPEKHPPLVIDDDSVFLMMMTIQSSVANNIPRRRELLLYDAY